MTLQEAIDHYRRAAENSSGEVSNENARMASWLMELKMARVAASADIQQMAKTIQKCHQLEDENAMLRKELDARLSSNRRSSDERKQELITPEEYAERLNVSRMTVYRMCSAGKLAAVKVGQQLRIDAAKSLSMLGL